MIKIRKSNFIVFAIFLVSGFLAVSFAHAENQEGCKVIFQADPGDYNPEEVGTPFGPEAIFEVSEAQLVTPEDMEAFEMQLGDEAYQSENVPFMPTDDPQEYAKAKAKANAEAKANAPASEESDIVDRASNEPGVFGPPGYAYVHRIGLSQTGPIPPDTMANVGLYRVVEVTNVTVRMWQKFPLATGSILKTISLKALFYTSEFVFDPRVLYDPVWKRWVIIATRKATSPTDTTRRLFIAFSRGTNPTKSWWVYHITMPLGAGDWVDYPMIGLTQDAILITGNIFHVYNAAGDSSFVTTRFLAFAKAAMYNGYGYNVPVWTGLTPTLAPPVLLDNNRYAYLIAANNLTHISWYRGDALSNGWKATLTKLTDIDVPNYSNPPDAVQYNSGPYLIDTLDRRFQNHSTQYGDSLWNVHPINSGGLPTPKFYEFDTEGAGAGTVKQQGLFYEATNSYDFNPHITANLSGQAFCTWSTTRPGVHNVWMRYSGRQPADTLGLISAGGLLYGNNTILTGNRADPTDPTNLLQRWGDYSSVQVDPYNTKKAWICNEVVNTSSSWGSRIGRIGYP